MCCQGWERIWSVVHVVWSAVYVCCGAGQLVAGIFFILALPSFILGCNLITGTWNILMGIGVGMVACCSQVTSQRQETLLYMTVAILTANVVNAVISEWGFYAEDVERLMGSHQYNVLVQYASLGTRITGAVVILTAFLDAQLAFCSMQSAAVTRAAKKKQLQLPPHQQHYHHNVQKQQQQYHMRGGGGGPGAARNGVQQQHEQVSDIEYIIPRQKPAKSVAQNQVLYNAYSQSWVFDAENNTTTLVNNIKDDVNNPTSKSHRPILVIDGAGEITRKPPKAVKMVTSAHQQNGNACAARPKVLTASSSDNNHLVTIPDTTHLIANPNPVVHVEDVSDDSTTTTTTSDRKLYYMKSFSRSASPQVLSASSSQLSLNQTQSAPPIYECLDHHQQYLVKGGNKVVLQQHPSQQQHVNTDDSNQMRRTVMTLDDQHQYQVPQIHKPQQQPNRRSDATSPQTDPVQYACLLKELQSAIGAKKEPQAASQPVPTGNSTNRSSVASATSSSKTSNSDAEFSKELEAALQLIQDLESPNTVESTPSEVAVAPPQQIALIRIPVDGAAATTMLWRSNSGSDDSEKTISAVTSPSSATVLPRPTGEFTSTGKGNSTSTSTRILVQCPGDSSQSTSGYSSPTRNKSSTHTPVWSTTSSINGSSTDIGTGNRPLTYTIHNTKSTAVISLYPQTHSSSNSSFVDSGTLNKSKSVTLVNITNNNNNSHTVKNNNLLLPASGENKPTSLCIDVLDSSATINRDRASSTEFPSPTKDSNKLSRTSSCVSTDDRGGSSISGGSATGTNMWSVKSLLRKKKQLPPRLCPELEGAIVKSESLAYLTEVELVARHDRNTSIQRQIEQKVHQQLSTPRTDYSNC